MSAVRVILKVVMKLLVNPELRNLNWDEIQHFFAEPDASCFAVRGLTPNEHATLTRILKELAPVTLSYDSKGRPVLSVRREQLEVVHSGGKGKK